MGATSRMAADQVYVHMAAGGQWLLTAVVVAPVAIVCGTVVILVLSVARSHRLPAVKALTPVLVALVERVRTRLRD
ncbi:hypothetical protein ACT1U9_20205 [Streptomyces sp. BR1]|uniref:hypothetical protein n=1 Tax=unclassified Streptomyces TaxID=2593676 RepID=UPI0033FD21DD